MPEYRDSAEGDVYRLIGKPLMKKDGKKSVELFGSYIHTYKFDEVVADGVVPDLRHEVRDTDQHITLQLLQVRGFWGAMPFTLAIATLACVVLKLFELLPDECRQYIGNFVNA